MAGEADELVRFLVYRSAVGGARRHVAHELLPIEEVVLTEEPIQVVVSGVVARFVPMPIARARVRRERQVSLV